MRILITAGPTHEPIDAVRYIANRSSGALGAALAQAALDHGHAATLILGPVTAPMPPAATRVDIQTARQLQNAVLDQFPRHDLLIMAAAVADYRPRSPASGKLPRSGVLTLELEPTEDILAAAGRLKRADQRTVGFSLEANDDLLRARRKLVVKNVDLMVCNPLSTMGSADISAVLLYPNGHSEVLTSRPKAAMADILIQKAQGLFA